jgi:putative sigma-54 modulation protein
MKEYAREKVGKLEHIFDRLTKVEVTLGVVHDTNVVEIVADANRGARLVGKAESPDMYAAVDLAEEKLSHQLRRHKARLVDHHRGEESMGSVPPGAADRVRGDGAATDGPLESFDDVIERLGDE